MAFSDTFARSVSNGLGDATSGETWELLNPLDVGQDLDVDGDRALLDLDVGPVGQITARVPLGAAPAIPFDLFTEFVLTSGNPNIDIIVGETDSAFGSNVDYVTIGLAIDLTTFGDPPDYFTGFAIGHGGPTIGTAFAGMSTSLVEDTVYRARLRVTADQIRGRVWAASGAEPATWHATLAVDTTAMGVQELGFIYGDGTVGDTGSTAEIDTISLDAITTPAPGVWVDWQGDGTFDDAAASGARLVRMLPQSRGVDDEITSDVHSIDWQYGGSSDHVGGANPGTMTLRVKNSDGKYNADNTSSTLYGYLKPGKRIWAGLNADGSITGTGQTVYGIFAGYIREIVPLVEDGATALAEIICEDPLSSYARRPVRVAAATTYSYRTLREAILADIGEASYSLAAEIDTLPLAAADSDNALSVLNEIDKATASRSWSNPADSKEDWQTYTVVDRHHKLEAAVDASINADDVQGISGYRVTSDNIINYQAIDVSQAIFPAGIDTVWEYAEATIPLNTAKRTIWATFDDFVKDATLDYTSSGSTVTATLTNFGTTAKIELWSAGTSVVSNLSIEGRMVVREATEAVYAENTSSQSAYEKRVGPSISSVYSSTTALAQGVADFMVWKFAQPLKRPAIEQVNEFTAMLPRDMYDVIGLTVDRLHVAARRFEIVGISGRVDHAATGAKLTRIRWELQETPNQAALSLFTVDTDALNGSAILGR